jgi:RNA polymerase sigma-70 factor (ECF subfamily)
VDALDLGGVVSFHVVRADLLRRLGRATESADALDVAIARTSNLAERTFLERRRNRK